MAESLKKKKGGLKSLFFKEPEEDTAGITAPNPAKPTAQQTVTLSPTSNLAGQVDANIKTQLLGVLEKANIPGYDYFEFRDALQGMGEVITSEPDRFKAAYKAIAKLITKDKLVETAKFYLAKLEDERQKFQKYVAELTAQNVDGKEEQAKNLETQIVSVREDIAKLTQKIGELEGQRATFLNESVGEKTKIKKVSNDFETTCALLCQEISQDIQKITTYIQ